MFSVKHKVIHLSYCNEKLLLTVEECCNWAIKCKAWPNVVFKLVGFVALSNSIMGDICNTLEMITRYGVATLVKQLVQVPGLVNLHPIHYKTWLMSYIIFLYHSVFNVWFWHLYLLLRWQDSDLQVQVCHQPHRIQHELSLHQMAKGYQHHSQQVLHQGLV